MEIEVEKQAQYSDGTWQSRVTFVLDYAVVSVSVNTDRYSSDDEQVIEAARGLLAHDGIELP